MVNEVQNNQEQVDKPKPAVEQNYESLIPDILKPLYHEIKAIVSANEIEQMAKKKNRKCQSIYRGHKARPRST